MATIELANGDVVMFKLFRREFIITYLRKANSIALRRTEEKWRVDGREPAILGYGCAA